MLFLNVPIAPFNAATKNGQNYLDATERNKTNYNNAVDSANGVINATSNPNMDVI
jgi:hypothetical protein